MIAKDARAKLRIYRGLYGLNIYFAHIVEHCAALGEAGALPPEYVTRYQAFAQELQAQINDDVIEILQSIENDDLYRFGKVRENYEKEMRDQNDVFIQAEERRRELSRQAKTIMTVVQGTKSSRPHRKS